MKETSPFSTVEITDVSPERISRFTSEKDFIGIGIELTVESANYISIASNILGCGGVWSREQAVIGGNMVRLYKLLSAVLDQTVQDRRETSFILARLSFETIVSILYLCGDCDKNTIDSYIKHSLDHEKRLSEIISNNVIARDGLVLPIENRMRSSIDRMLNYSGMTLDEIPRKKERNWGGKNLFEKAECVGLGHAYTGIFANASQNVHGAWGDLFAHHLNVTDDGNFTPKMEWQRTRPHLLYSLSLLSLRTPEAFALFMGEQEVAGHLTSCVNELADRINTATKAHEAYLAGKTWPEI